MDAARTAAWMALVLAAACSPFSASEAPAPEADSGAADAATPAADAAAPPDGATPGSRCARAALACDDFEGRGSPTDLTGASWPGPPERPELGLITDAESVSPSHSLEVAAGVADSVALVRPLEVGAASVTARLAVRFGEGTVMTYAQLLSFVLDGGFFAFVVDNDVLVAQYHNGASTVYQPTGTRIRRGVWMRLSMLVRLGAEGHVVMSVDERTVHEADAATTPRNQGASGLLRLGISGGVGPFGTAKLWFDDLLFE